MAASKSNQTPSRRVPFNGYNLTKAVPESDEGLTRVGPGTPMGEYMRRFWHPVCLSVELGDVPKPLRILGENLIAFRDKSGQVGLLHRYCSHRNASLEYGIICRNGIRCAYHGWKYNVDGTIAETPVEPPESTLKDTLVHGAYSAFERNGLVWAYLGPIEFKPPFPEYDCFTQPAGTKLVPFSNIYPCNWLQVFENIADHFHTCTLHSNMVQEGVSAEEAASVSLAGFAEMPIVQWEVTHGGKAMAFSAGRRMADDRVWVRITALSLPNLCLIGSPTPQASRIRHSRVGHLRWHTPVDDENMIVFGWRIFNDEVDPEHVGREEALGVDKFDFLEGVVGNRTYDQGQRAPGDYEIMVSLGAGRTSPHSREHPGRSDVGVYMLRKLLRAAVSAPLPDESMLPAGAESGRSNHSPHTYAQDSVLRIPKRDGVDDAKLLTRLGKEIMEIMKEGDALPSNARAAHIRRRLNELGEGNALHDRNTGSAIPSREMVPAK